MRFYSSVYRSIYSRFKGFHFLIVFDRFRSCLDLPLGNFFYSDVFLVKLCSIFNFCPGKVVEEIEISSNIPLKV